MVAYFVCAQLLFQNCFTADNRINFGGESGTLILPCNYNKMSLVVTKEELSFKKKERKKERKKDGQHL